MSTDPFDLINLAGAICGIIMVCGGIMLLRVGAIKLSEAAKEGSFSVQIRKDIKITTSYPALGIFVIGLLFIVLSAYMAKPDKELPLSILGQLDVTDPGGVTIQVEPDQLAVNSALDATGKFDKTLHPYIRRVKVTIVASGYDPEKKELLLNVEKGKLVKIPDGLIFTKVKANPGAGEIKAVAAGDKLPPPAAAGAF